jgi:hypothetical protein
MLALPNVTLLSATAVSIEETIEALEICMRGISFADVRLLCPERPKTLPSGIEHVAIPPMDFEGYSRFILGETHRYFDTSHCLVVQADGFVVNPGQWRQEYLDYDYIGAPWPTEVEVRQVDWRLAFERNRVGNGGFSVRSHRLMRRAAQINFDTLDFAVPSEDLVLCHYLYDEMCAEGMRFAPIELAARFSVETVLPEYGQTLDSVFGFHGKHLLPFVQQRLTLGRAPATSSSTAAHGPPRKPGRNELCPCGSGRRFKNCHGALA